MFFVRYCGVEESKYPTRMATTTTARRSPASKALNVDIARDDALKVVDELLVLVRERQVAEALG